MSNCFHCGKEIVGTKAVAIIVVDCSTGKLGSAQLHCHCTEQSLSRYRQNIEWEGRLSDIETFKALHRRLANANRASYGAVPTILLAGGE